MISFIFIKDSIAIIIIMYIADFVFFYIILAVPFYDRFPGHLRLMFQTLPRPSYFHPFVRAARFTNCPCLTPTNGPAVSASENGSRGSSSAVDSHCRGNALGDVFV